jgi:hypothetical protein
VDDITTIAVEFKIKNAKSKILTLFLILVVVLNFQLFVVE